MRFAVAIFLAAWLLTPPLRWVGRQAPVESCACPPDKCTCPGHMHHAGHSPMCTMANGGRCGIAPSDAALLTRISNPLPAPTELEFHILVLTSVWSSPGLVIRLLAGHSYPPKHPPRTTV